MAIRRLALAVLAVLYAHIMQPPAALPLLTTPFGGVVLLDVRHVDGPPSCSAPHLFVLRSHHLRDFEVSLSSVPHGLPSTASTR